MDLFIVLSPAAYVAFAYATFGHFAEAATNHTNARAKGKNLTLIPARKFATTFVISDVITFLIQAGGGGLQVKQDSAKIGADIFLAGSFFSSFLTSSSSSSLSGVIGFSPLSQNQLQGLKLTPRFTSCSLLSTSLRSLSSSDVLTEL
ncbi:hypothetical protein L7F22_066106 [Adiantum nelumboides]|nr:hypothetical protein [Adiantum nelumboides]